MRRELSGCFAWHPGVGVGSSRSGGVGASPRSIDAHRPPKRGERRDAILSQCYEAIEDGIDIVRDGRVDVGFTEAWTRCLDVISETCRSPRFSQSDCSAHKQIMLRRSQISFLFRR